MRSDTESHGSSLAPHISVTGGNKALDFYQTAFGAMVTDKVTADDGNRVRYAALRINNCLLYLSDEFPEMGAASTPSPATLGGTAGAIHLGFASLAEAEGAFRRAVDAGCEILMPMTDTDWGARYGRLRDPFGHVWSFGGPLAAS